MAELLHEGMWMHRRQKLQELLEKTNLNKQQSDPLQPVNILDPLLYSAAKGQDVDGFIRTLEDHCKGEGVPLPFVLGLRSPLGNTLLHAAAENSDNVRAIIDFVPEHLISCQNSRGETPLHIAARAGIVGAVELLLHTGDLTCTDHNGNSALHEAVRNRHYEVIQLLVRTDPNPLYRQNKESKSPWCEAVETEDIRVLMVLLETPIDGEDQIRSENERVFGMSPVHVAIIYQRLAMLTEMWQKKSWLFQLRDAGGGTPLHLAAYINYLEGVKFLMQHCQTDALEQDSTHGYLPIHIACMMGHVKIVNELLQRWPDPAEFQTKLGRNILHVSAQHGRTATVKYILKNPNFGDLRLIRIILIFGGPLRSWEMVICKPTGTRQSPPQRLRPLGPSVFKDHVSTLLVVATLIASVAFVSGFSVPGGYYGSDTNAGLPALLHKAMYNVFVISNSTALYSSIMTIVMLLWTLSNDPNVTGAAIVLSTIPLWVALTAIPLAFMAGVYGTVTKLYWLSIFVLVHGSLALFIFLSVFLLFFVYIFPHQCRNPLIRRFSDQIIYCIFSIAKRKEKILGMSSAPAWQTRRR